MGEDKRENKMLSAQKNIKTIKRYLNAILLYPNTLNFRAPAEKNLFPFYYVSKLYKFSIQVNFIIAMRENKRCAKIKGLKVM